MKVGWLLFLLEVLVGWEVEGFGVRGGEETAVGQQSVSVGLCVALLKFMQFGVARFQPHPKLIFKRIQAFYLG